MPEKITKPLPFALLPPRPARPLIGSLLIATGLIAIVYGLFAPAAVPFVTDADSIEDALMEAPGSTLLILASSLVALLTGVGGIGRGRRLRMPPASDILFQQQEAPVLFLRSFDDDDLIDPTPRMIPLGDFFPRRYEESFARALRKLGPMIAIGRPGSRLPELGSQRLYVPDHAWKDAVEYLRTRAAAVLIVVGTTEGLWWEIDTSLVRLPRERLLFFFPYAERRQHRRSIWQRTLRWWMLRMPFSLAAYERMEADRQARYRVFRERAALQLDEPLPAELNDAQFMHFTAAGKAQFLPTRRPWWVVFAVFLPSTRRMVISLRGTLRPFVGKLPRNP